MKVALAYVFGLRTDSTLKQLLERLIPFKLALYCTDNWGAYERLLPEDKHLITKRYTQSIERQNLNLRTWIKRLVRKMICFSKSIEIHDKVIGTCIERRFFNSFLTGVKIKDDCQV